MKHSRRRRVAFTLIEVLLVIGLLVVLSTMAVMAYTGIRANADKDAAGIQVKMIAGVIERYQIDMGVYPETDEGLKALVTKPEEERMAEKWRPPYLTEGRIPVDPWGNEYKYERLEQTEDMVGPPFRVFSYGPDGQEGTDDDISSYEEKSGL